MKQPSKRFRLLMAVVVAATVLAPVLATAATPRAQMFAKDAYEPDETSATAKSLPVASMHTLSNPGTTTSEADWSVVTIAETGTPLFVDTSQRTGMALPIAAFFVANTAEPSGLTTLSPVASMPWGGIGFQSTYLLRAPRPGTYYVSVQNGLPGGGAYQLVEKKGALAGRLAGPDRFTTAVAVSKQMWPGADSLYDQFIAGLGSGAPVLSPAGCILATGRNFADALAASAWINMQLLPEGKMPILLTEKDSLPASTRAEILRLASLRRASNVPFTVYIVGGPPAVSSAVEASVSALNATDDGSQPISGIVRLAGPTRFDTAARIAQEEASSTPGIGDTVFIVNGFSFADALSAGPVAGASRAPVLLVTANAIPAGTAAFLTSHPSVHKAVLVGSESVVGTAVASALAAPPFSLATTRVAGPTRYQTSRELASYGATHGLVPASVTLVTGQDFPDGLAAAGLSAFQHSPLLLTQQSALPSSVASYTATFPVVLPSFIVGGPPAVSTGVEDAFNALWRTMP